MPQEAAGREVSWRQIGRMIASRYPPIDLFERVSSNPAGWEALIELEQLTNPRLRDEAGDFISTRSDDVFRLVIQHILKHYRYDAVRVSRSSSPRIAQPLSASQVCRRARQARSR